MNIMGKRAYGLFLVLAIITSCKEQKEERNTTSIEVAALESSVDTSDILFKDLHGNPVALSDFKGKRVLLNFWATWCRPCIEEMPSLLKAKEILEKENYIFLLATDQPIKTIKSFKEKKNFDFNYIKLNGAFAQLDIKALPVTFIYNENGDKVDQISGAVAWDSQEMIHRLKAIE